MTIISHSAFFYGNTTSWFHQNILHEATSIFGHVSVFLLNALLKSDHGYLIFRYSSLTQARGSCTLSHYEESSWNFMKVPHVKMTNFSSTHLCQFNMSHFDELSWKMQLDVGNEPTLSQQTSSAERSASRPSMCWAEMLQIEFMVSFASEIRPCIMFTWSCWLPQQPTQCQVYKSNVRFHNIV